MHACPHCGKESFTGLQKWWASAVFPATCPHCDGLSHVATGSANSVSGFSALLFALVMLAAATLESPALAIIGGMAAVALYLVLWQRTKLSARTSGQVKRDRRFVWFYLFLELVTK